MQVRIGNLLIITVSKRQETFNDTAQAVREYLGTPDARHFIAKLARSEAKDYIAENYERNAQCGS